MVVDINLLREDRGGNPEFVRKSEKDRFKDVSRVDQIVELDKKWRNLRHKADTLNRHKNTCSKLIGSKMKAKQDPGMVLDLPKFDVLSITNDQFDTLTIAQLKNFSQHVDEEVEQTNKDLSSLESQRDDLLNEVGNIIHPTVVVSNNEDDNKIERIVGNCNLKAKFSHVDLLQKIDGVDYKRGAAVAGNRGYFLKSTGLFLAQALIQYSLKKLYDKGYTCLYTPFFMNKKVMHEVAQLSQFDEELYKVLTKDDSPESLESEEKYLIATSEQAIAAYHRNEWLDPQKLPLKYAGISTCFRQEAGSHGRDTTGIFRVHQFEKVEQFVVCSPNNGESWKMFDMMIANSEELCTDLGLGYRIVSIVSGALNNAAAKKYDLEGWFPGSSAFRELVSCSNCTDYQSRRLGIRFGLTKQQNKDVEYVHMLNATMCAVTRVLCILLETHQKEDGIDVPSVLHPYLPADMKFIPFK